MTIKLSKTFIRLAALFLFAFSIFTTYMIPNVAAVSENVVIRRVQLAGASTNTSDQEYVELYNNSDTDVDVTGWCLQYNQFNLSCIQSTNPQTRMFMTARASILVMNPSLQTLLLSIGGFRADLVFNADGNKLAVSSGSLRILNQHSAVVDTLGWVNGVAEGSPISPAVTAGKAIQRHSSSLGVLIDTDNNSSDFEIVNEDLSFSHGGLYESTAVVDQCLNTPEIIEEAVPENFIRDTNGDCYEDLCPNISDLQITVPNGYQKETEACLPIALRISEVLPNVTGSDTGKEFVELYNPSTHQVNLAGYTLQLNPGAKKYTFNETAVIQPDGYLVFSDSQLGFVLPNTSGKISLIMPDQTLLYETHEYLNPKDDDSWAFINDTWQYTKESTPGSLNQVLIDTPTHDLLEVPGSGSSEELASCGVGKYRNPETNRCKTIESTSAEFAPCNIGQERNPETNRCRSITSASSTLIPCSADQERNPETNRCRIIGSTEDGLKPCAEDQERNPETNRCRKVETPVSGTVLAATAQPATIDPFRFKTQIIAVLIAALLGYGLYEYRSDISNYIEKIKSRKFRGRPPD